MNSNHVYQIEWNVTSDYRPKLHISHPTGPEAPESMHRILNDEVCILVRQPPWNLSGFTDNPKDNQHQTLVR
ncbi:hypothetical protein T265_12375 [Opisthorchis viverrini]|uniref:Uncharacterized protein n=1 Tax=Opisthorchis viverrini TaxID=6198 RepID=A0A074YTI5_OPIVI|nr:hypothetical protein T265_12375 [Opisthorchis viverrini]KER18106.1 hypothetical protein T265_12375 [Opisthorchis viverrini]